MVRGPTLRWVAAGVAVALLAGGLTYAVREGDREPDAVAQPTVDALPKGVVVGITRIGPTPATVAMGAPAAFAVEAAGVAPIAALELWAGDQIVASHEPATTDATSLRAMLEWTPTTAGATVVTARAIDVEGRSAQSNTVRAEVVELEDPVPWVSLVANADETLAAFAARVGATTEDLLRANPDLPADGPLPPGTTVDVPQFDTALPEASPDLVPDELRGLLASTDTGSPTGDPTDGASITDAAWRGSRVASAVPARLARPRQSVASNEDLLVLPAPELAVTVDDEDCEANLTVSKAQDAQKVVIEMLAPAAPTFDPVAAIDGESGDASTPLGPGAHLFVATATDGTASAISPPIVVNGPGECEGTWNGDVKLVNGILSGGAAAELAYLYLSSTPGPWMRVPSGSGTFVAAGVDGTFDFTGHLPTLGSGRLQIEAWGWRQGALVRIGGATFTPKGGLSPSQVIGATGLTSLHYVESDVGADNQSLATEAFVGDTPGLLSFQWATSQPGVTHGVWQVTTLPPDPSGPLDPAGVIAQGTVEGDGGQFQIDFGKLTGQPQTLAIGDQPLSYAAMSAGKGASASSAASADEVVAVPPGVGGKGSNPSDAMAISSDILADLELPEATEFYVRILPFSKDTYKGLPSNRVRIDTKPLIDADLASALGEALDQKPYDVDFTFTAPQAPNLAKVACWKFKGWNPNLGDPKAVQAAAGTDVGPLTPEQQTESFLWSAYLKIYASHGYGVSICPGYCYNVAGGKVGLGGAKCGGGGFDPLGGFVNALISVGSLLWDKVIVGTFNAVKGFVVDTLVDACTAFGDGLLGAGQTGDECGVLAEVAVDAVLMAFGIPPTLPTTEQAIQLAKGELQELMVELANDLGVPCDEVGTAAAAAGHPEYSCEAAAAMLLDELDDQLQQSFRQQAAAVSGLMFPPGMEMVPDPEGQITPARFDVTVTPNLLAPPTGETCSATAALSSKWWTGPPKPNPTFLGAEVKTEVSGNAWVNVKGLTGQMMHTPSGKVGSVLSATLPPRLFTGLPFVPTGWKLPSPQAGPNGELTPATRSYYLYQPVPYDPVAVTLAMNDPGSYNEPSKVVFKPGEVPYHSFLLQPSASHTATMFGSCFGFAAGNLSIDLAAPQTKGVSG